MKYNILLKLFNINRDKIPESEWMSINFDQIIMSRQNKFEIHLRTRYKVGGNIPNKRLEFINNVEQSKYFI